MQIVRMFLFASVLSLALPSFDALASDLVDTWRVGQKVVFYDKGWFRGTITEVADEIPFLRKGFVRIKTDSGEIHELTSPMSLGWGDRYASSLWSAEYACDSRGLCVGQTVMASKRLGHGEVLTVKIVSIDERRSKLTTVVGEVVGDQGKYKTGELVYLYYINLVADGECNSEGVCVDDRVMFPDVLTIRRGRVLSFVENTYCYHDSEKLTNGGYVIESKGGSLVLKTNCLDGDEVAKIYSQDECDPESGLCGGQPVYYLEGRYIYMANIEAANGRYAYIQLELSERGAVLEEVDRLGLLAGCMDGYAICVGDKVLKEEDGSSAEVLGRFTRSMVLRTPSGGTMYLADKVYIQSGCVNGGFCVGDEVQVDVSGHKAKVVGVKGELMAIKFLSGERVGQIGFGWRSTDLRK